MVDQSKGGLPGDAKSKNEEYNKYIGDFCEKYKVALPARSTFIRALVTEFENAVQ